MDSHGGSTGARRANPSARRAHLVRAPTAATVPSCSHAVDRVGALGTGVGAFGLVTNGVVRGGTEAVDCVGALGTGVGAFGLVADVVGCARARAVDRIGALRAGVAALRLV